MSFPVASTNNQTTLINGITYVWNASIGTWTRQQTYLGQLVVSATPPTTNSVGTQWYSTTEDIIYEWATSTGNSFFWLDISSSAVVSNSALTPYLANLSSNTANSIGNTANSLILAQENLSVANVLAAGGFANTSNAAYAQANAAFANSNTSIVFLTGVNTAQNTNITSAFTQANLAYNAANTNLGIPQNLQSSSYTLQLSDQGKHIYYATASNVAFTLPNNGTVSWPVGTSILIVLQAASPTTINLQSATGVTMYLAGNTAGVAKTYANIASYGVASLLNVNANTWFINGSGVS